MKMDYKKLFDLTGKVAVVTGGTGYKAVAKQLEFWQNKLR